MNLANLVDSLRGRVSPNEDADSPETLPPIAVELFERCAREYQRESDKLVDRRRRIGALVYPATPGQTTAIIEWFVNATGLRIVEIDARLLVGLSDGEVADRLTPLKEPTARIVAIRGIGYDVDSRLSAAIASAHVDVLVVAFADPDAKLRAGVQRRLRYRIDLLRAFPLDVAVGCFDGLRRDLVHAVANENSPSPPSHKSPGKRFALIGRLLHFLRSGIRTAGS